MIARVLWGFNIQKKQGKEPSTRMLPGFFSVPEPFECDIICRSEKHRQIMLAEFENAEREGFKYRQ